MGKFISGIAVLSACVALSVNPALYAGSNILSGFKTENILKQEIKNKKAEKPALQILKDASAKTSAMCLWEHNSSKTEMCWLFDKNGEQEIIDYINGINPGDIVKVADTDKLNGSIYGIGIGQKDGTFAQLAWFDGYIFLKDGSIYKADIDFDRIKNNYLWQEKNEMSLQAFPNMYYIAANDGQWNKNFLEKSGKLKSNGLKVTFKKCDGKKLIVKLKNNTKKELCYGEDFSLQVKLDDGWYYVPAKEEIAFPSIANIMKAGKSIKKTYNISPYGEMPSGKYRIVIEGASAVFNI